jgi:hypothetical protein
MKSDTDRDVRERYRAMLLGLPAGKRVAACCRMFDEARILAAAGLAEEPDPLDRTLRTRLFLRFYGRDYSPDERIRIISALDGRTY